MNNDFWAEYYRKAHTKEHTLFAEFCLQHLPGKVKVLDIGCGNGRDSLYLAAEGHQVLGVDMAVKPSNAVRAKFLKQDISQFIKKHKDTFDVKYCRFFFHAVEESVIDELLAWIEKGFIFIEARDKKDTAFDSDHDRNLVHLPSLLAKLGKFGFEVVHQEVAHGLAPYKDFDPAIVRIVAKKK